MEMEYKDSTRRGKFVIILGVILAIVAGGAAFYLINQAQQQAGQGEIQKVKVVVAGQIIPARTPIQPGAVQVREIALDAVTQVGIVTDPGVLTGKVLAIPVAAGQPIYQNMILGTSSTGQSGFSILGPDETIAPDSPNWRAISITIPDDRAVAGLLVANQTIDIFMTAQINAPANPPGVYYSDMTTKITYQDMVILGRAGSQYILKCTLPVAEEINHLLATGTVTFSAALRPDEDVRFVDVAKLGATTNRILQKYGLPFPVVYPAPSGPVPPQPPLQTPTPPPPAPAATAAP